jgi:hypothetical protein
MKTIWKAYIAGNQYTEAFDSCYGKTQKSAEAAIKRRNSPDWQDCCVWSEEIELKS